MKRVVEMKKLEPSIKEIVAAGGNVKLTVTGKSMLPILMEYRDSVILEKTSKLKKGDIALYRRSNGDYVLHRVVKIKKDGIAMCGDNQKVIEYPIMPEQIIATCSAIIRKGKRIEKNNFVYRLIVFAWISLIPFRPQLYRLAKNIRKRLK
ncbi:MAG: S24/S26 family peptidase [Clostridia bacterium]|nr:S24/S26 family peptidase [Clostridia bacterium]